MKLKTELWVMRVLCVVMTAIGLWATITLIHQVKQNQTAIYHK